MRGLEGGEVLERSAAFLTKSGHDAFDDDRNYSFELSRLQGLEVTSRTFVSIVYDLGIADVPVHLDREFWRTEEEDRNNLDRRAARKGSRHRAVAPPTLPSNFGKLADFYLGLLQAKRKILIFPSKFEALDKEIKVSRIPLCESALTQQVAVLIAQQTDAMSDNR
jgi:hypothetical protein